MFDHLFAAAEFGLDMIPALRNSWPPHRFPGRVRMQYRIAMLLEDAYEPLMALDCEQWRTAEPVPFTRRETGAHRVLRTGDVWAENTFDCAWMHVTGQLPEGVDPADPELCFLCDIAGEGLVFSPAGEAMQGITSFTTFCDFRQGVAGKRVVKPEGILSADGRIDFWIDAAANDLFGNYFRNHTRWSKPMVDVSRFEPPALRKLHLARCNPDLRALHYDCFVLAGVYDQNERDKRLYAAIERALETKDRSILKPYFEAKNETPAFKYSGVGHAHMDLAWLWPIRETYRKGARTFANQVMNMKYYPDAVFGSSQAQLYAWVKDMYPDIYAKVKDLHAQGRWELLGAPWVEPDTNLIGGESMIRQFYYGQKFFKEEFGGTPRIVLLPDTFGYSACIPQVMRLAGTPYFITIKLSQNTRNEFPFHTFHWHGLDGSRVLAHMPPEDSYVTGVRPASLAIGARQYRERGVSNRAAALFGIGDGGGGPGFEHLERAARLRDLKGLPKYTVEPAHEFFRKLEAEGLDKFPGYHGELYLEKHQGCYTTQARCKKYNRKCEILLGNYEVLVAMAGGWHAAPTDLPIPMDELDEIWKEILLYQFHDILPGSSIDRVYEEAYARYAILQARLEAGVEVLLARLYGGGAAVNLNSFDYDGLIEHEGWRRARIPAFGSVRLDEAPVVTQFHAKAGGNVIENDCARVVFHDGAIASYIHKKTGREVVTGPCNVFSLYTDMGNCWDFENHDTGYQKSRRDAKCTAFSVGAEGAKAFAKAIYFVGEDLITQEISLTDGSPMLRFRTKITHGGENVMLRVRFAFPDPGRASFNLPFGHITRATTEDDPIEAAQFEVSGQKFVDLSTEEFGVSLLNDCKYGFRCKKGMLDICLLRSPRGGPGKHVDFGGHSLEYAIYPHEGPLGADTYAQAYFLNNPVRVTAGEEAPAREAFIASSNENIVVESVKLADDGNGLLLRTYNCSEEAQRGEVRVASLRPVNCAGVMEDDLGPCDGVLEFRGFELKIVRFVP